MANTPKIRYEIEAAAVGDGDVRKLTSELERLDDAISPETANKARALVDELNSLGKQQAAISRFGELKTATTTAAAALEEAQAAAQKLAAEIAATAAPTRAQTGQLEKLKDAVRAAKTELQAQTAELDQARAGLTRLGIPLEGLAAKQAELRNAMRNTRQELEQLNTSAGGVNAFTSLAAATEDARVAFTRADAELEAFRATLTGGVASTRAQQLQLDALTSAARQSQQAFAAASQTQAEATAAARAAGVDVAAIAQAQQRARAATLATAEAARDAALASQAQGRAAVAAGQQQAAAASTAREGLSQLAGQLQTLQGLIGTVLGGELLGGTLGDLSRTADAYANLAARMKLATGEGEAFTAGFEGVFEVAQRTSSSLESTGTLFTKLVGAGKELGVSQRDALALTETINQAVQLSGSSAQESDAAIQQLIQGLGSGVLRGEEFNSVMEQAPRLAQALASGLGITTAALRQQAEAGALSSQVVISALQGQAATVANEFSQLPPTVGRALTNLGTAWTDYVGRVDQANGISATAASAIDALAGNLDTLGTVLFSAGKAAAAYTALRLGQSFLANATAATQSAAATAAETAAKTANTAALATNTAATAANTAAKGANAAAAGNIDTAAGGAAVQAGRLAQVMGTLSTLSLIGLVTNLGEIGTWLGESIAKWQGYGKAQEEAERSARALEQAQREMKATEDAAAAARKRNADAMMGLSGAAKELVGEYESVIKSGGSATEALEKLAKAGSLSDITGIRTMSAALDSLTVAGELAGKRVAGVSTEITAALQRGGAGMEQSIMSSLTQLERLGPTGAAAADSLRASLSGALETGNLEQFATVAASTLDNLTLRASITGQQVRESLAEALKGEDLLQFEANARAAFDGSEQGARRLSAALEAIDVEALRRAGTSADELRSGFNAAAASAINDVDALAGSIERLGVRNAETARAMAGSLDKALEAATTERAVQTVIDRMQTLGQQGLISGDQLSDGLDKARAKLDEIQPGISSLDEALKSFGLKSRAELQQTADKLAESWQQIANSTQVSLQDKIKAFEQYRDAAAAANDGVVPSQIRVQEQILRTQAAASSAGQSFAGLGDAAVSAGQRAAQGFETAEQIGRRVAQQLGQVAQQAAGMTGIKAPNADIKAQTGNTREERLAGQNAVDATGAAAVRAKLAAGTLTEADRAMVEAVLSAAQENAKINASATRLSAGAISWDAKRSVAQEMDEARRALDSLNSRKAEAEAKTRREEAAREAAAAQKTAATTASPSVAASTTAKETSATIPSTRTVNVNLTLGGRSATIPTSESGADALLKILEQAQSALGS